MTSCIAELRINKAANPFRVWDSRGTGQQGKPVRAVDPEGGDYEAVSLPARYTAGGILIGTDRRTREPVVSSQYFSPLTRVDATRIEPGEAKEIGTFLAVGSGVLTFRDIVLFLLESQVVTTYWHVESILCLVTEDDTADVYKAHFRGRHIYYTNQYNEEKLDFSLGIEKKTGRMSLVGGG